MTYEQPAPRTTEYHRQHDAVRRAYGSASQLKCWDCPNPAVDWSWQHGENPDDVNSYRPRCRKCHTAYDGILHLQTPERVAASAETLAGSMNSRNRSGEPGIAWHEQSQSWRVRFQRNGKQYHGGHHKQWSAAIAARDALATQLGIRLKRLRCNVRSREETTTMPFIVFHEPYYTSCVRNYVASQMPTGELVSLVDDDGEIIAAEDSPGEWWPEYLATRATRAGYTMSPDDILALPSQETFDVAD